MSVELGTAGRRGELSDTPAGPSIWVDLAIELGNVGRLWRKVSWLWCVRRYPSPEPVHLVG